MPFNRRQIRQAIIDEGVWRNALHALCSATGGPRSISALELGVGGDSPIAYHGRYVHRPDGEDEDVERKASTFHPTERSLELAGPDYTTEPAEDEYFEVLPYAPSAINQCMNLALVRRCFSLQRDDIVASGDNLYTIGTAPFDVLASIGESAEQQIFAIEELVSGTSGDPDALYRPWDRAGRVWTPEIDGAVLTVRFDPAPSGTIRVIWKKPYTALANELEATTTACPLAYVKWATLYELYLMLERRAVADGVNASSYRNMKEAFEADMLRQQKVALTDKFGGRVVQRRSRSYGSVGPSHRLR